MYELYWGQSSFFFFLMQPPNNVCGLTLVNYILKKETKKQTNRRLIIYCNLSAQKF